MLSKHKIFIIGVIISIFPFVYSSCDLKDPDPTADIDLTILYNSEVVENAIVTLYSSEDDWANEENPISESKETDEEGKVFFFDLDSSTYFMDIVKDSMNLNNWEELIRIDVEARVFGFLNTKFGEVSPSKMGLLSIATTGKKWLTNSIIVNNTEKIDTLQDCEKDNLEIFFKNKTYFNDKGNVSCSDDEPQSLKSGTWDFNEDKTQINIVVEGESTSWNIINLTSSELIVEKNILGQTYQFTYELKSE